MNRASCSLSRAQPSPQQGQVNSASHCLHRRLVPWTRTDHTLSATATMPGESRSRSSTRTAAFAAPDRPGTSRYRTQGLSPTRSRGRSEAGVLRGTAPSDASHGRHPPTTRNRPDRTRRWETPRARRGQLCRPRAVREREPTGRSGRTGAPATTRTSTAASRRSAASHRRPPAGTRPMASAPGRTHRVAGRTLRRLRTSFRKDRLLPVQLRELTVSQACASRNRFTTSPALTASTTTAVTV